MSVKRYTMFTTYRGHESWDSLEEDEEGGYVSHEDYAALEQQLTESYRALRAETAAHENTQMQLEKIAAENAGLKVKGREVLKEAAYVYSHYNRMVDHLDGESVDGQTLHEFQEVIEKGTPATYAYMSERGE